MPSINTGNSAATSSHYDKLSYTQTIQTTPQRSQAVANNTKQHSQTKQKKYTPLDIQYITLFANKPKQYNGQKTYE